MVKAVASKIVVGSHKVTFRSETVAQALSAELLQTF